MHKLTKELRKELNKELEIGYGPGLARKVRIFSVKAGRARKLLLDSNREFTPHERFLLEEFFVENKSKVRSVLAGTFAPILLGWGLGDGILFGYGKAIAYLWVALLAFIGFAVYFAIFRVSSLMMHKYVIPKLRSQYPQKTATI